jgi:hypothetical protein
VKPMLSGSCAAKNWDWATWLRLGGEQMNEDVSQQPDRQGARGWA